MNNKATNSQAPQRGEEEARRHAEAEPPPIPTATVDGEAMHIDIARDRRHAEAEPPPVPTTLDGEAMHTDTAREGRLAELQTTRVPDHEELQAALRNHRAVIAEFDQQAPGARPCGDAASAMQRDDWRDAETDGRCPENHYGWLPWCENAISETAIAHLAVCHASDGTVWTRTSTNDTTRAAGAAREMWDKSFPLFRYSGDAQSIIRKMSAEACWATGGEAGRRLCEAETRLAFAASYHARLAEHSSLSHLPWDILDQIQSWLRPQHQLLCAQGSSLSFQGESWVVLRFAPCTQGVPGAAMLIARRDHKGLTAFRTARSLVVTLVDERARSYGVHGAATNDAGSI